MIRKVSSGPGNPPAMGTAEDFVAELRRLRAQAGDPSFRQLSRIAQKRNADAHSESRLDPLPPSTTSEVLAGRRLPRLPRLEFVESYVAACLSVSGLDEPAVSAEVARWRDRWRSLAAPSAAASSAAAPEQPEEPAEPVPANPPRPRRRSALLPLVVAAFLAGLATGVVGTWYWTCGTLSTADTTSAAEPSAEAPDVCLPSGTALPAGQDVLRLPPAGQKTGSWWVNEAGSATLSTDGRRFRADVTAGTSRPGDVLVVKSDITLVQGRSYALSFISAADRDSTIRVRVQDSQPPAYQPSYDREVSVTPDACLHLYRFAAAKTSAHSELTFQVGGRAHDFQLEVHDTFLVEIL